MKHVERNREDKKFDFAYRAVLAGRMKQEELYKVISKEDKISDEDLLKQVNSTIDKFSKKGGK